MRTLRIIFTKSLAAWIVENTTQETARKWRIKFIRHVLAEEKYFDKTPLEELFPLYNLLFKGYIPIKSFFKQFEDGIINDYKSTPIVNETLSVTKEEFQKVTEEYLCDHLSQSFFNQKINF